MDDEYDTIFMHQYDLVFRQGLFYKKFSNVPFTGEIDGYEDGKIIKGLKEGEWLYYDEDGQLESKRNYKKGIKDGVWVYYSADGELWKTIVYKDGKLISETKH